jgi:hypothetical protein
VASESDAIGPPRRDLPGEVAGRLAHTAMSTILSPMTADLLAAAEWLDRFFTAYHFRRPVNATFIGRHEYDAALPDYSDRGMGDTVAEMEGLLRSAPDGVGSPSQRLDVRLAKGFLKTQLWEFGSGQGPLGNPSLYTGEAVFGVMSLFLSDFAPTGHRVEAAIERLHATPALLAQGRANVREAPTEWVQRALRECEGGLTFLSDGIAALGASGVSSAQIEALSSAGAVAAQAFADFSEYLRIEIRSNESDGYSAGQEALDLHIRQAHFLPEDASEIVHYAEVEMAAARAYVMQHAVDFGVTSPEAAVAGLADLHPKTAGYLPRYASEWKRVRSLAEREHLLTWPDFPIEYAPRPAWSRAAAPYLYFLFYRSPAAYGRPPVHKYMVTPIEAEMPADLQSDLLRANNDSAILLNHVIHHGGIGHHVQNWHAFQAESRVGQMAAVDCASRTAMQCAGTMAEGWACYATDLMAEFGALTPLQEYAERQSRVRMCARAVVDVRLHQGRMTFEGAVNYYRAHAGMSEAAATGEVTKNSMFPAMALMYLMGTNGIHSLRRELARRPGFELRDFHDRFLSYGSVPVALIAESMTHAEAEDRDK